MKTEAIHRLINEAEEARGAAMELHALEESHVTLLEALAWCRGYFQRVGDAAALATLDGIAGDAS